MTSKSLLEHNRHLPIFTLQEMSRLKVMTSLCNLQQLRNLVLKCELFSDQPNFKLCLRSTKRWKAVIAMANEMVSQRCKSTLLKKIILELLWPVSYNIMMWKCIYALSIKDSFVQCFHWTDRGRIDNKRTIRSLIGNKKISIRKRFALACSVCLEIEITEIWFEMSSEDKAHLYADRNRIMYPLIRFWLHTLEGSYYDRTPYLENALQCATTIGLLEAVKYLFAIAPENKTISMQIICIGEYISRFSSGKLLEEDENDILYFVFSQMTDEYREHFLNHFCLGALSLFLHFSKYEHCLLFLQKRLETAHVREIARALGVIFYTYHLEIHNNEDCRLLFMDFWRMIPTRMRKSKDIEDLRVEFLAVLIRDNFSFILEKDASQKIAKLPSLDLIFIDSGKQDDFHEGKWDLLNFIIKELITIPLMKKRRNNILFLLKGGRPHNVLFNRLLRFVRKVRNETPCVKN